MTTSECLVLINEKLRHLEQGQNDLKSSIKTLWKKFDDHRDGNCSTQRELKEHKNKEHKLMWSFIIALPMALMILMELVGKVFRESK